MSTNKQSAVRIALGTWDRLREDAYSVRHEVFVVEQKVPPEVELDDDDAVSVHAVALAPTARRWAPAVSCPMDISAAWPFTSGRVARGWALSCLPP